MRIGIIDYESGNLRSVSKAVESVGAKYVISSVPEVIQDCDAAILPGVGSGPAAMKALRERNMVAPIKQFVDSGKPLLCICLGLQLLMDTTEEGESECLKVISGNTKKIPSGLKLPHMGWNTVDMRVAHPLFKGIPQNSYFYFVHSYYAQPNDVRSVAGVTTYGDHKFCSILATDNIVATQFHPEKSGKLGIQFYENFLYFAESIVN